MCCCWLFMLWYYCWVMTLLVIHMILTIVWLVFLTGYYRYCGTCCVGIGILDDDSIIQFCYSVVDVSIVYSVLLFLCYSVFCDYCCCYCWYLCDDIVIIIEGYYEVLIQYDINYSLLLSIDAILLVFDCCMLDIIIGQYYCYWLLYVDDCYCAVLFYSVYCVVLLLTVDWRYYSDEMSREAIENQYYSSIPILMINVLFSSYLLKWYSMTVIMVVIQLTVFVGIVAAIIIVIIVWLMTVLLLSLSWRGVLLHCIVKNVIVCPLLYCLYSADIHYAIPMCCAVVTIQ